MKPENIFIKNNSVKLADFGWSNFSGTRQTFCGTIDYIPPEMILNQNHDEKVDIWSLGVMFYEMLYGYLPFRMNFQNGNLFNQRKIIERNILNGKIEFKDTISSQSIQILQSMLEPSPNKRVDAVELLKNPYFSQTNTQETPTH